MKTVFGPYVFLDLETTGLDPKKAEIIEFGAVRGEIVVSEDDVTIREIDRYETLISPVMGVDDLIEGITGISNEMLLGKPMLAEVQDRIRDFIGEYPICGHNITFDTDFLNAYGIDVSDNELIDTYDIASVVTPQMHSYNLGELTKELGVPFDGHHRAFNDAFGTFELLAALIRRISNYPESVLKKVRKFLVGKSYPYSAYFEISGRKKITGLYKYTRRLSKRHIKSVGDFDGEPLVIDPDKIEDLFSPEKGLAQSVSEYSVRESQVQMAREISEHLSHDGFLAVEAGTGVGKSLAYLVPSAVLARDNDTQVLIATHSKTLQDQLSDSDIPKVKSIVPEITATLLKGRKNYICTKRLSEYLARTQMSNEEVAFGVKMLLVMPYLTAGERDEFSLSRNDYRLFREISSRPFLCSGPQCSGGEHDCFYATALHNAKQAHLVITNHSYLFSSQRLSSPEYPFLVIDEAHHIEDVYTNASTKEIFESDFKEWLHRIGEKKSSAFSGFLGTVFSSVPTLLETIESAHSAVTELFRSSKSFFRVLREYYDSVRDTQGKYIDKVQLGEYSIPGMVWLEMTNETERLLHDLSDLREAFLGIKDYVDGELEGEVEARLEYLESVTTTLTSAIMKHDAMRNVAYLQLIRRSSSLVMRLSPIHVASQLSASVFENKKSVILTSATLRTGGDFSYFFDRLGLRDVADTLALKSPFRYQDNVSLYLPEYRTFDKKAEGIWLIEEIIQHFGGRVLVLFTSYSRLKEVHRALSRKFLDRGITLLSQGIVGSRKTILRKYKESEKTVIFGTNSFWEGVDLPGDLLRVVVIEKLPFDVPSDPIFAARSDQYENPFHEYALKKASLRFVQGFGRLIRRETDEGVVAVLDPRIREKRYGKYFIESLPEGIPIISSLR